MKDHLLTEEEYREMLKNFVSMISDEIPYDEKEFNKLIQLLQTYEYENC
jgi:hypothetical protein